MTKLKNKPEVSKRSVDSKLVDSLKQSIRNHLRLTLARREDRANSQELWTAICLAAKEHIMDRYMHTQKVHVENDVRRVHYLSLEYLMGRLLNSNLSNLGILEEMKQAVNDLGFDLPKLGEEEHDMGLGNGGLGRLAACFLDSMATMDLPLLVMEYITNMDCLSRNSRRVGRSKTR